MFVLLAVLVFVPSVVCNDNQWLALKFGATSDDYIGPFRYDMSPFSDSLSICMWVKRVHTSSPYPIVFNYYPGNNEILISSNGYYNQIAEDSSLTNLVSKFTSPVGTWYHYCATYSPSSGIKLYLDGDLIGSAQGPGRSLKMGGTLFFNRLSYSTNSNYIFGGELYQFNLFSGVLSATSVKKIAQGGLCFDLEEFSATRVLRWEEILEKPRSGDVKNVTGCDWKKELEARLNKSEEMLANVSRRLNETEALLVSTEDELNTTREHFESVTQELNTTKKDLGEMVTELNSTKEDLGALRSRLEQKETQLEAETARHNKTEELLESCSATLTDCQNQLKNSRTFQNITRWDILYTRPYFNNQFTDELYEKLTTTWEMLRQFVGVNMTEGIIEHFREYHNNPDCESMEQFSSSMLGHFLGIEMTSGIIAHFRDIHEDSECDTDTES